MPTPIPLVGGKNILLEADGAVLTITTDLSKDFGLSSTGKSVTVASTSGNKPLGSSNAFLGLNIFTKSIEARDLSGVSSLLGDFTDMGEGCQWRVLEDKKTLCIKIDFSTVKEREASSGKSFLLACSKGNKPIGSTGIVCGLNCYRPVDKAFEVGKLCEATAGATNLTYPSKKAFDHFEADFSAPNCFQVRYTFVKGALKDKEIAKMPSFFVDGITTALLIGEIQKKKKADPAETVDPNRSGLLEHENIKNVKVDCKKTDEETFQLTITIDPTKTFGRTGSAKSLMVATSSGYREVLYKGLPVCRLNLNFYKSAKITDDEVRAVLEELLGGLSHEAVSALSFKTVLKDVLTKLGLEESHGEAIKEMVKNNVKDIIGKMEQ
ncbi:hypothetical protein AGDE_02967 [Angomonas deanei]|nr:hypothetical protein AGDE_07363 [Angomonas deanei]EPY40958.1 hypothetical protein AGDE_02967 [Angomonas deanei]|eukprot:EPY35421.1 hypothetical protein AGDE_07363 [Angomonas deanei]